MQAAYIPLVYAVLALHVAFAAWVFVGGFLARRSRRLVSLHMASAAWGVLTVVTGFPCPLTRLENHFRSLGGLATYTEECIPHYVWVPLGLPQGLAAPVLLISVGVVLNYLAYRPRRASTAA